MARASEPQHWAPIFSIRFTTQIREKLERISERTGRPIAWHVNEILGRKLKIPREAWHGAYIRKITPHAMKALRLERKKGRPD